LGHPLAVDVGELVQPVRMAPHALGHVNVVVRVVVDPRADDRGLIDAVAVHLPEELLDRPAALRIGHRRLVRPVGPGVAVRVDDHGRILRAAVGYTCSSTGGMALASVKTAISLDRDLLAEAEAAARDLRTTRSGLIARALADFLARRRADEITAALNE